MPINRKPKQVFIFGAGASYASSSGHIPLGKDLIWKYYVHHSFEDGRLGVELSQDGKFENYERFLKLVDKYFPGLNAHSQWQKERSGRIQFNLPFGIGKELYADEIAKVIQDKGNLEEIKLLRELVLEHIGATIAGDTLYKKFMKKLVGRFSEDISIISFNFDCLLQEQIDLGCQVYFDYLIPFDTINENRRWYNKQNGIPLIKLNGSLDWAICQECGKIKLLSPYISKSVYANLSCTMSKKCLGELRPFIFLPHENKNRLIHSLWDRAREDLKQAEKITVIGYSFPPYDQDVINLFKDSIGANVELLIIDYADNDEQKKLVETNFQRLKQIFSLGNMNLRMDGFKGYLN